MLRVWASVSVSVCWGERLLPLRVSCCGGRRRERKRVERILSGRVSRWVASWASCPGGSQIKSNAEGVDVGLSEVAFPGLGPGEGMLWSLFRKLSNQLVMGYCFFLSFFIFIFYYSSLLLLLFFPKL